MKIIDVIGNNNNNYNNNVVMPLKNSVRTDETVGQAF